MSFTALVAAARVAAQQILLNLRPRPSEEELAQMAAYEEARAKQEHVERRITFLRGSFAQFRVLLQRHIVSLPADDPKRTSKGAILVAMDEADAWLAAHMHRCGAFGNAEFGGTTRLNVGGEYLPTITGTKPDMRGHTQHVFLCNKAVILHSLLVEIHEQISGAFNLYFSSLPGFDVVAGFDIVLYLEIPVETARGLRVGDEPTGLAAGWEEAVKNPM
ncbi:hypothetical protein C8J57DRAFT_1237096 [Mycena rebaudengoi]|nr:hypothetical protein C8J57DRAFT_1237096 [Mycena rebaudengoi]